MKLWSIITLTVFLNFMALPSIATFFDWDLPATNMVISEEETQHSPLVINEKTIPGTLNVHDFLKFFETDRSNRSFICADDSVHLSPFLTIFSPPPEA
ncbi:MAG TPA: hypothetical protein DCL65_01570 [Chryseobacterium sp.]|uniref:Uncharacterized protein n=1 Tax=Kaistella yananensis TaxID=2989820 RepID=A0ABT3JN13_9FLAO|nr:MULTISPECIES: hypothetical protein [Chryseobacterium group]MCW4451881.1 hypothetical protein [Kaistella yananensis]OWR15738.1 hypothetical protein CDW55_04885 [Chryseobacterium sp. VAUSW3]HAI79703.1 hypothetical protein [Chryseobacterium sp.]